MQFVWVFFGRKSQSGMNECIDCFFIVSPLLDSFSFQTKREAFFVEFLVMLFVCAML